MPNLFGDLIPQKTSQSGLFDDLTPASFGNVAGGSSSSPSFAGVQSGGTSQLQSQPMGFGVEEGEGITGGDITQAASEIPSALYQGLKKASGYVGKTAGLAAAAPAGLFDDLVGTDTQGAIFKNVVAPYDTQEQQSGQAISQMKLPGQIVGGITSAAPDVMLGLASGGESLIPRAVPLVEGLASHVSRLVANATEQGIRMSAPLAEKAATEAYSNRINQGGSQAEATGDAIKAIASTSIFGVTGQSVVGSLPSRVVQGAAAGAATGEAVRELEGREFNPAELGVNATLGGAFAVHGDAPRSPKEAISGQHEPAPMEGSGSSVETPPRASTEPTEAFQDVPSTRGTIYVGPNDILYHGTTPDRADSIRENGLVPTPPSQRQYDYSEFGPLAVYASRNKNSHWFTQEYDYRKLTYPNVVEISPKEKLNLKKINTPADLNAFAKEIGYEDGNHLMNELFVDNFHGEEQNHSEAIEATQKILAAGYDGIEISKNYKVPEEQSLRPIDVTPDQVVVFNTDKLNGKRDKSESEVGEVNPEDLTPEERQAFGMFDDLIENNASGESAASLEALNRFKDDQAAGQHRMILNRDGSVTPIVTADGVDYAAKDGQIIVQANIGDKPWTILDHGDVPKGIAEGRVNAASDSLNRAAIERMKPDEEITLSSEPEAPKTTSTKNAVVEAERSAEGRDPIIKEAAKSNESSVREAETELAKNPAVVDGIVEKLTNDGPKNISTKEEAVLLVEKTRLRNAREAAAEKASDPKATEEERAQAKAEWSNLEGRINEIDKATTASGTEWGRFGQLRQRQMNEDFSLAAMESRERVARGRPLNEAEAAQLKAQAEKIQQLHDVIEKGKTAQTIDSKEAFAQLSKDLSAQLRAPSKRPWLETMKGNADDSRKALESMFKRASAGVDPMAFYHLSRIGAYHIANGAVKFSDFVGRMKNELGDKFEDFSGSMKDVYNAAKLQRDALRAAKRPQMTEEGYQQRAEKSLQKRIEVIQDKIARGDYKKTARTERELNKSNLELSYQLSKLKQQFGERQFEIEQSKRPAIKKIFGGGRETLNLARAIMTSFDLSAVLRQGGFVALGRPVLAAKSIMPMLKAFANEKNAFKVQEEIAHRPNARLYEKSGLELTKANDHHLTKLEENYMSRWIGKLPRILGGGFVRGSERAFKTFLNKLRADTFDAMAGTLSKSGTPTLEEAKAIANYINVATGRGKIGVKGSGAVGLNTLFFAPRLVASRFNLLAGQPLYGGTARTRKMVAKEYARFAAGLGVVYTLGAMAHAGSGDNDKFVETDPRSSNFGKMKFGNTYIDPLTGIGQIATVIAREVTGETKTQKGAILPLRKDNKLLNAVREKPDNSAPGYGKPTAADVALNFARTKLAPVPGAVLNVLSGKNVIGQPTSIGKEAKQLITPLSFQNVEGVLKENGITGGSAITLLEMLGMGVQYRDPNQKWK